MLGEHMHFVNNIDLVAAARGGIANLLTQVADLVDAAVRGAIDLHDVQRAPHGDRLTRGALVARLGHRTLRTV